MQLTHHLSLLRHQFHLLMARAQIATSILMVIRSRRALQAPTGIRNANLLQQFTMLIWQILEYGIPVSPATQILVCLIDGPQDWAT